MRAYSPVPPVPAARRGVCDSGVGACRWLGSARSSRAPERVHSGGATLSRRHAAPRLRLRCTKPSPSQAGPKSFGVKSGPPLPPHAERSSKSCASAGESAPTYLPRLARPDPRRPHSQTSCRGTGSNPNDSARGNRSGLFIERAGTAAGRRGRGGLGLFTDGRRRRSRRAARRGGRR